MKLKQLLLILFVNLTNVCIGIIQGQCDGLICDDNCVDINFTYINVPQIHCNNEPLIINVLAEGSDVGTQFINFSGVVNGQNQTTSVGGFFPGSGNTTSLQFGFASFCEPTQYLLSTIIRCSSGPLIHDTIGIVTVYPSLDFVTPTIIPPENCGEPFEIIPPICGTFSSPIDINIYPDCGSNGQDEVIDWSIDLDFDPSVVNCYTTEDLSGQLVIEACDAEIGDTCEHPCLGPGLINADCECEAFETPQLVPSSFITGAFCSPSNVNMSYDIIGNIPEGGLELIVNYGDLRPFGPLITQTANLPFEKPVIFNLIGCEALFNENIYAYLRCPQTFAYLSDPILIGIVDVYPDPAQFEVLNIEDQGCGQIPNFELNCGSISEVEFISPSEDCSNLSAGRFDWTIDPGFDTSTAPDCFQLPSGSFPILPCGDLCPCPTPVICGDVPINLITAFDNIPSHLCSNEIVLIDWIVLGDGVDQARIFLELFVDGNPPFVNLESNPGDPSVIRTPISLSNNNCEPIDQFIQYKIRCTNTILEEGQIGPITVLPDQNLFLPQIINEPSQCGLPFNIEPPICGDLVVDPIPTPNCTNNQNEHIINWSVNLPFNIPADLESCFNTLNFSGQVVIPSCDLLEGDVCSDPCLGDGVIDSNCNCAFDNPPIFSLNSNPNGSFCHLESIGFCFDVSGFLSSSGYSIQIVDQNNINRGGISITSNSTSPLCSSLSIRTNSCDIEEFELFYRVYCNESGTYITNLIPFGTVSIYPFAFDFVAFTTNGFACGEVPGLISDCGEINIVSIVEPVNGANGSDGSIEFIFDHGFDLTQAPECFEVLGGNGSFVFTIEACEECGSHGRLTIRAVEPGN